MHTHTRRLWVDAVVFFLLSFFPPFPTLVKRGLKELRSANGMNQEPLEEYIYLPRLTPIIWNSGFFIAASTGKLSIVGRREDVILE